MFCMHHAEVWKALAVALGEGVGAGFEETEQIDEGEVLVHHSGGGCEDWRQGSGRRDGPGRSQL